MANTSTGFRWTEDRISPKLKGGTERARRYLSRVTTYHALRAENYMRDNAPWTDRSTNARSGLRGLANNSRASQDEWEIQLGHSVSYGIFLELKQPEGGVGKYAIIVPTIRAEAPEYWETARQVLQRIINEGMGS